MPAKKSQISYKAKRLIIQLKNVSGKKINIIFHVSDDGVAFRYHFPEKDGIVKNITEEFTSFHFDTTSKGFFATYAGFKIRMGTNQSCL